MRINLDKVGSAFEAIKEGDTYTQLGKKYTVLARWRMSSFDRCPHCGSGKTFHTEAGKHGIADNVHKEHRVMLGGSEDEHTEYMSFSKIDLCLWCGRDWVMELWVNKVEDRKKDRSHYKRGKDGKKKK